MGTKDSSEGSAGKQVAAASASPDPLGPHRVDGAGARGADGGRENLEQVLELLSQHRAWERFPA